jgi:hypothetical protein
MFLDGEKDASQIDQAAPIQLQGFDGSAADRRKAQHEGCTLIPHEVISPVLPAGVKQRHHFAADWISSRGLFVLVIVAPLASPCQIFQPGFPSFTAWFYVLGGKRLNGEAFLASAILTTAASPVAHSFPTSHLSLKNPPATMPAGR